MSSTALRVNQRQEVCMHERHKASLCSHACVQLAARYLGAPERAGEKMQPHPFRLQVQHGSTPPNTLSVTLYIW